MSDLRDCIQTADQVLRTEPASEASPSPRWQAVIAVGEYLRETDEPELICDFIERWGTSNDDDIRAAIACCLLEHLIELHFEATFHRIESKVKKNWNFADCFRTCWSNVRGSPSHRKRYDNLKKWVAKRGRPVGPRKYRYKKMTRSRVAARSCA